MRDFHLSMCLEAKKNGIEPISLVRVTRERSHVRVYEDHQSHGVLVWKGLWTVNPISRNVAKLFPLIFLYAAYLRKKYAVDRVIVTGEGFCFGVIPSWFLRGIEVFYHDPVPHVTSGRGLKSQFEERYKSWVHEKKCWRQVLVASREQYCHVERIVKSPVHLIEFPRFTKNLFKKAAPPPELSVNGYLLVYGRIDSYKGVYEWLETISNIIGRLPPVVIAGRVVDHRVYSYSDLVTIIDRYIAVEEVYGLFFESSAVVLPYKNVTHSGVADIALSFGKVVYLSDLPYFKQRYQDDEGARPIDALPADYGLGH